MVYNTRRVTKARSVINKALSRHSLFKRNLTRTWMGPLGFNRPRSLGAAHRITARKNKAAKFAKVYKRINLNLKQRYRQNRFNKYIRPIINKKVNRKLF